MFLKIPKINVNRKQFEKIEMFKKQTKNSFKLDKNKYSMDPYNMTQCLSLRTNDISRNE